MDKERAKKAITQMYVKAKRSRPEFIFVESPVTAYLLMAESFSLPCNPLYFADHVINARATKHFETISLRRFVATWFIGAHLKYLLGRYRRLSSGGAAPESPYMVEQNPMVISGIKRAINTTIGAYRPPSDRDMRYEWEAPENDSAWHFLGKNTGETQREAFLTSLVGSLNESSCLSSVILRKVKKYLPTAVKENLRFPVGRYELKKREPFWPCKVSNIGERSIGLIDRTLELERIKLWEEISEACFCWWPFEKTCIVSEKPERLVIDNHRLHSAEGPAIRFRDGWEAYFLNGVEMPKKFVTTPVDQIDPEWVARETNAERRKELVRRMGVESLISRIGAKVIDKWGDYELLDLSDRFPHMRVKPTYLRMKNPSTGEWHLEGVPPGIKKVRGALKWRIGGRTWKPVNIS